MQMINMMFRITPQLNAAPVILKHSKSVDLLRKSLLSHVSRVLKSNTLSCKHEQSFDPDIILLIV